MKIENYSYHKDKYGDVLVYITIENHEYSAFAISNCKDMKEEAIEKLIEEVLYERGYEL